MPHAPLHRIAIAGGAGTRLWPLSRKEKPKQFLDLRGRGTLIEETLERVRQLGSAQAQWLVVGEAHEKLCRELLPDVPVANILAEPKGLNTAPAIALAAYHIHKLDSEALMAVFPADQHVGDPEALREAVQNAARLAEKGSLVTLGITPTSPETGFGYIERGAVLSHGGFRVSRFCEKPDRQRAEQFLASGNFSWNAGIFVMRASAFLEEYERQLPEQAAILSVLSVYLPEEPGQPVQPGYEEALRNAYSKMKPISVDYGVMEGAEDLAVVPTACGWSDVGSLSALGALASEVDAHGNRSNTTSVVLGGERNILWTDAPGHVMALVGIDDVVVVHTRVATVVLKRDNDQAVRDIVSALKEAGAESVL